jgi:hypothetical protein
MCIHLAAESHRSVSTYRSDLALVAGAELADSMQC